MTIVIGAVSNGRVYMAGDSYIGGEDVAETCSEPKVIHVAKTVLLGVSGDTRAELLVTKSIKTILARKTRITEAYLKTKFSLELYNSLKDAGILQDDQGIKSLEDSSYILGHAGKVYYIDSNLALWSPQHPYVAIGQGRQPAMGALAFAHASGFLDKNPTKTVEGVMDATHRHSHFVRPPYVFLSV